MTKRLDGKVALITGGAAGFGKGTAETFAREGAKVYISDINVDGGKKVAEDLGVTFFEHDVTNPDRWQEVIAEIKSHDNQLNILVNNAGITKDNLTIRMKENEWQDVIDINLNAVFFICQHSIKVMIKKKSGCVINITSVVGHTGNAGQANYTASKAGIIAMTKSLAKEYAKKNIRLNCVSPGFIATDMTNDLKEEYKSELMRNIPLNRLGKGEDIARAVMFLSSNQSSYITGETIHVNGGMYMS